MRREQKITLGEMRSSEVRGLLIYCGEYKCAHWIPMNADPWPDDIHLSDLEPLTDCRKVSCVNFRTRLLSNVRHEDNIGRRF
jgi:hypothetical protein